MKKQENRTKTPSILVLSLVVFSFIFFIAIVSAEQPVVKMGEENQMSTPAVELSSFVVPFANSSDFWDNLNVSTQIPHNSLASIQGGATDEFFHLNQTVFDFLMANIFDFLLSVSGGTVFDQDLNTTDNVSFINVSSANLLPNVNNTGTVGSEQLQWANGFFQQLNVSDLGGLSPINLQTNIIGTNFNITADTFFGDVNFSQLAASSQNWNLNYTNLVADSCSPNSAVGIFTNGTFQCAIISAAETTWVANWTAYNDTWSNITNDSYVLDSGDNMTGDLNMTGNDILNVGTGFFNFLGSLANRIIQIFATDVDISNNLSVGGNLSVDSGTLFVDSSKNFVGINTANPDSTLDIIGDLNMSGNFTGNQIYIEVFNRDESGVNIDIINPNEFVKITGLELGDVNGFTFDNGTLTAEVAGVYFGTLTASVTGGANQNYIIAAQLNGVVANKSITEVTIVTAGKITNIALTTIRRLNVGDNITLVVADNSMPVSDIVYTKFAAQLVRIGN